LSARGDEVIALACQALNFGLWLLGRIGFRPATFFGDLQGAIYHVADGVILTFRLTASPIR
jgi:hypothetical protein